ncbi:Alpha-L-fucosidase [Leucoagaricus sp. SymC.cos]|nr:Alpha-L-fucosidase [Leucoagaricus sp. SymC.cos]
MLISTIGFRMLGLLLGSSSLLSTNVIAATLRPFNAVSIPLQDIFDNQAASPDGSANFDGHGGSFDSTLLPHGPFIHDGVKYDTPEVWGMANDNVITNQQVLNFNEPTYVHELHLLYSGDVNGGEFVRNFELNFEDNSTQTIQLYVKNWFRWPNLNKGEIRTRYHFVNNGTAISKNFNSSQIYQWSTSVLSESKLQSITLPPTNPARRLHLFAMAFTPSFDNSSNVTTTTTTTMTSAAPESEAVLSVRRVRFTTKWEDIPSPSSSSAKTTRAQIVEVTLANILPSHEHSPSTSINSNHTITITGSPNSGIKTVQRGRIMRLVPGDQARVDVLVTGTNLNLRSNEMATVEVRDVRGKLIGSSNGWQAEGLVENWTADEEVLGRHEAPTWWKKAKYGIFIHWGVYSAPAWAPNGTYAEWYNWNLHNPPNSNSPVWNHHLETYGPNVLYDDFIANFTASKFNASAWVDLFDKAGAKYFVFVTKHHDGFALFDTQNTTHRSSVYLGPTRRDFLKELMDTAKKEKPQMRRGTYYSLPEWFNPDSQKYGFGSWPGGLAHNPFPANESTRPQIEPYTGRLNITDYIDDLQVPQMLDLATKYDTEVMWCDIGGPNKTLEVAAQFYNHARSQGRQVTLNNRCGAVPDFDTPEYATFGAIQTRNWESNEGMDPFSYGLNSATDPSLYKNATTIIQTLVDIVSKNGNFLLDVGPNAEGEIIAPMANNLLDAGKWLDYAGECIFDTDFWFPSSQDQVPAGSILAPARFTTTPTSLCIVAFNQPTGGELVIQKRLPLLPDDKIFLMHPDAAIKHTELQWNVTDDGRTTIQVTDEQTQGVQDAWAFQIQFNIA